jgi:hypothetical protein
MKLSYGSNFVLSELRLPITEIEPAHGQNGRLATRLGSKDPQSDALQRFGSHGINFVCHLRYRDLATMDQQLCKSTVSQRTALHVSLNKARAHLTTEVLNLDRAALESHREAALELVFGSAELFWGYDAIQQKCELVYEVGKDRRSCRRHE